MNGKDQAIILKQNKLMLQSVFIHFPELTTERLLLRRITQDDAPEIYFLRSDEKVLQFIGKEPARTMKEAEDFIAKIDDDIEKGESIMWGIALKEDPAKPIGTICYWRMHAILEAAGFVKEGCLKEEFIFRDKFLDTVIYSRLQ
jgi:RimJ/RimL family protein N-acetyltransferase